MEKEKLRQKQVLKTNRKGELNKNNCKVLVKGS